MGSDGSHRLQDTVPGAGQRHSAVAEAFPGRDSATQRLQSTFPRLGRRYSTVAKHFPGVGTVSLNGCGGFPELGRCLAPVEWGWRGFLISKTYVAVHVIAGVGQREALPLSFPPPISIVDVYVRLVL